eukprot:ANDGO_04180.mRNA.1 Protein transport protein SEC31 homolog B
MFLKQVSRTATFAWSPSGSHLVAGSMAGSFDADFSASAKLEIFSCGLNNLDTRDMSIVATIDAPERFSRLDWGGSLIAGALVDGSIQLWNADNMISSYQPPTASSVNVNGEEFFNSPPSQGSDSTMEPILLKKHEGDVRALQFNPFQPSMLASGGADGQVYIWTLGESSGAWAAPGGRNPHTEEVSDVAWNRKVAHILGSTSINGLSVVWDLKQKRPVFTFADKNRKLRCSAISWNPENATQVAVASEDDASPVVQIWDLRTAVAPIRVLEGHSAGILSLAWCPDDAGLLLSCGRDNRVICWNPEDGRQVAELPASDNWVHRAIWSPKSPSIVATGSFDGKISVLTMQGANWNTISGVPPYAPKWLRRPASASFGFGGKLVSVSWDAATKKSVGALKTVITDPEFVARAEDLDIALSVYTSDGHTAPLSAYCQKKTVEYESRGHAKEAQIWKILGILFTRDTRNVLMKHLGYVDDAAPAILESSDEGSHTAQPEAKWDANETSVFSPNATATTSNEDALFESVTDSFGGMNLGAGTLAALTRSVVTRDFPDAVARCIRASAWADALLLASCDPHNGSLWEKTRRAYLDSLTASRDRSQSKYGRIVSSVVNGTFDHLIQSIEDIASSWKDVLAVLCSYASQESFSSLVGMLGSRLEASGEVERAVVCYMCAGDMDKCLALWDHTADYMEKACVLQISIQFSAPERPSSAASATHQFAQHALDYATRLAAQGRLALARKFIAVIGAAMDSDPLLSDARELRDRLDAALVAPAVAPAAAAVPAVSTPVQSQYEHLSQGHHYAHDPAGQYNASSGRRSVTEAYQQAAYSNSVSQSAAPMSHSHYEHASQFAAPASAPTLASTATPASLPLGPSASMPATAVPATPAHVAPVTHAGAYQAPAADYQQHQTSPIATAPSAPAAPAVLTVEEFQVDSFIPESKGGASAKFLQEVYAWAYANADPRKKEFVGKALLTLFRALASDGISATVLAIVDDITNAIRARDVARASEVLGKLTTDHWNETSVWAKGLKQFLVDLKIKLQ